MTRVNIACLAGLALLATAAPVLAGPVYVPLVDVEIAGIQYRTQVWVSNQGEEDRRFGAIFIPLGADGTEEAVRDAGQQGQTLVAGNSTVFLDSATDPGTQGMLEFTGAPQLSVGARLVSEVDGVTHLGAYVPVISSENVAEADETVHLQGWMRSIDQITDYGVINLGHEDAQCEIAVYRANGQQIGTTAVISLPPLSQRWFADVLDLLGQQGINAVRVSTTCSQQFYTYANTYNRAAGESVFIGPSGLLTSTLVEPGAAPPPPPPVCPAGTVCFEREGAFHVPTPSNPVHRFAFNPPPGQYKVLRAQLDVEHGGWFIGNPGGTHSIFWLVRDRNRDMFGYVNVKGPNANEIFIRHGFNQSQGMKARISRPLVLVPSGTYHFDYTYDTEQNFIELVVTDDSGAELVRMGGVPNINNISFGAGQQILMDFGFPEGANPNEPPTYGWAYKNLVLYLVP